MNAIAARASITVSVTLRSGMREQAAIIRNRDEYHRCYGNLSQASRNIENCKLEMLKISIQRGFKYPQGSWVLASARRLGSGLTVTKTSDRIPVAWPLHLSVKWEIKYELLVRCINSWELCSWPA
jgi:hypothetical protein